LKPDRHPPSLHRAKTSTDATQSATSYETLFILDTSKPFEEACSDLKAAVASQNFGLLAVHDLAATLRSKNINFLENCRVFEVCNPQQAAKVLKTDMSLNMALPCRISVYTEAGQTRIGMIRGHNKRDE
jgi:uncharacterized protein (DUF302 family)